MTASFKARALGATITPMTTEDVLQKLQEPAVRPTFIFNHNLHSLYLYQKYDWFRALYAEADCVLIDGWPILKLAEISLRRKLGHRFRIGSTDWLNALVSSRDIRPMRVFVLGGTEKTMERACSRLEAGVATVIAGGSSGYFDLLKDADQILTQISAFSPDLILIGMGMPRQERFLAANIERLPTAYIANVGGAVDYLAGAQRLAPRIFGRLGIEWLWRLVNDPQRLWHRYLIEPIALTILTVSNRVARRGAWAEAKLHGDR